MAFATALCPYIGYKKSAEIAHKSLETGVSIRNLVLQQGLMTAEQLEQCLNLKALTQPGHIAEYKKI